MTESNLKNAFSGESQAHMRYSIFSERAEMNSFPNISKLFKAIAYAERVHARNHYKNIRVKGESSTFASAGFGSTKSSEDLEIAIEGETYEVFEMYPAYLEVARAQKEYGAEITFLYALEAEKTHIDFFKKAKKEVDLGRDVELGQIGICEICGYTIEGDLPEECPICKAKKDKFKLFI